MIFKTKMKRTLHLNDGFYWFIHFQKELSVKYTKMDLRNEKKAVLFRTILFNNICMNFMVLVYKKIYLCVQKIVKMLNGRKIIGNISINSDLLDLIG